MIDPKKIEQIARQVHESMPKGIREFGEDVEKKIRQTLQAQLTRLDLVSREEFDVQTQVLLRTREKLALLEQRISELEARNNSVADLQSPPAIPPIDKAEYSNTKTGQTARNISVLIQVLWFASSVGNTRHNVRKTRFYVLHPCYQ